jgi:hypothetical protein
VGDLILGNIPVPNDAGKYVTAAADEMDSYLGLQYVTPVVLQESIPKQRPGYLLLKRINSWLATGRLIMALDAGGEDDQLHQYGKSLVESALKALEEIRTGDIQLPGGEPVNPDAGLSNGPVASFGDEYSPVEAYDGTFGNQAKNAIERDRLVYYGDPRNRVM